MLSLFLYRNYRCRQVPYLMLTFVLLASRMFDWFDAALLPRPRVCYPSRQVLSRHGPQIILKGFVSKFDSHIIMAML
jgi:hypothetical protein